ncbi:hypothetical protein B0J17DRAFT_713273 [Rhizoctonia solani]|nr:hypothetical protein B0J17DRAFT_713273 [Rhizoctonia solani]
MLQELHTVSSLLCAALDRYSNACSALRNAYGFSYMHKLNNTIELMDTVTSELALVESYKSKLVQAQVEIKRAKNNLGNIPVKILPTEILTQIFHLVLPEQPCLLCTPELWRTESMRFPKYPDTLTHVYSQWWQIVPTSHGLWSHIDIALSCSLSDGFHDRATDYVARACQTPLDIHIRQVNHSPASDDGSEQESSNYGDDSNSWERWNNAMYGNSPEEFPFLSSSSGHRVRSLGLFALHQYRRMHSWALEHCLANYLPGGVSELLIHVPGGLSDLRLFETSLDPQSQYNVPSNHLLLSEHQLESAWHPTTTVSLKARYPH